LKDFTKITHAKSRDRDRNPLRPRPDLRHSRPRLRLEKTGLETKTRSRDSITVDYDKE